VLCKREFNYCLPVQYRTFGICWQVVKIGSRELNCGMEADSVVLFYGSIVLVEIGSEWG
jgi:hypothetical protein